MSAANTPVCINPGCNAPVQRAKARCAQHAHERKVARQRIRRHGDLKYPAGPLPADSANTIATEVHALIDTLNNFDMAVEKPQQSKAHAAPAKQAEDLKHDVHQHAAALLKAIAPWEHLNKQVRDGL